MESDDLSQSGNALPGESGATRENYPSI